MPSSSGSAPVVLGSVTSVSTVPSVSSGVASFPLVVTVTGSPSGLYSGTSANISIVTAQRHNVLVVPSSAVLDLGPNEYVEKLVHGDQVLTRVTTGLVGGSQTQITSGLDNRDQVAVHVAGPSTSSGPVLLGPTGILSPGGGNFKIIPPGGGGFIQRSVGAP
jgi:macrolide-specific efflux system membrane fusion protein